MKKGRYINPSRIKEIEKIATQNLKVIGARVAKLRKARDLSIADLARELKVKEQTLYRLEKGRYNFTIGFMLPITEYFGVDPEYLIIIKKEGDLIMAPTSLN